MEDNHRQSSNEAAMPPPPQAALLPNRSRTNSFSNSESSHMLLSEDMVIEEYGTEHNERLFSPQSWGSLSWTSDQHDWSQRDRQPKLAIGLQSGSSDLSNSNTQRAQSEVLSMDSRTSEHGKDNPGAPGRAKALVAAGKSKRNALAKSFSRTKNSSPAATRGPRKEEVLEDGLTDLDRALRSARDEIAKMQHELERCKAQPGHDAKESRNRAESITSEENSQQALESSAESQAQDIVIQKLRSDLQAEKSEKEFWKQKHDDVEDQYLKAESEVRILRANRADRDAMWRREWERKNEHLLIERDRCREDYHTAQKTIQEREEEIQELSRRILGLKRNISTWTKLEGQISDDVFAEKIKTLGHDLQNWTINNFRRAKIETSNLPESIKLLIHCRIPSFEIMLRTTSKLNFIQSLISTVLVDEVFSEYYFGLDDVHIDKLEKLEEYFGTIAPAARVNEWRSTTLSLIRQSSEDALQAHTTGLSRIIHDTISRILGKLTASAATDARDKGLQSIIDQAIDLSRAFRVQRAQFEVDMPSMTEEGPLQFDVATMEDITGENDEELIGRRVECVVFPCVIKLGDESGDNTHLRNVLVKAKVQCRQT